MKESLSWKLVWVVVGGLSLGGPSLGTGALGAQAMSVQQIEQAVGQMGPAEIVARLRDSGLSRAQVKDRLRRAGYDAAIADPYFDALDNGTLPDDATSGGAFADALRRIGLELQAEQAAGVPQVAAPFASVPPQPAPAETADDGPEGPRRFGAEVFRRFTDQFTPALSGPVGPDYRLGPGDEVQLVLTGDVQTAYTLPINREGIFVIPDVGQLAVNGLTLGQLRDQLYDRLGAVYSGVRRDEQATTRFNVSLGRLRTNQIRVVGEVVRPGAYQVSSVSTVLEALYLAGGPSAVGSFRDVIVRRGGEEVAVLDLYPYLTEGRTEGDIRLEQGDVVFVPLAGPQIAIEGLVRRAGLFELADHEGLLAVVRYAGGLLPDARRDRVQVDRVLPAADRTTGRDRVLLDAPLGDIMAGVSDFALADGDRIQVFAVGEMQRENVSIGGAVWRPGAYELRPGTTVASLIERAGGLTEDALQDFVQVRRRRLDDGTFTLTQLDLASGDGTLTLREFDEVTVFSRDELVQTDSVAVYGFVRNPGLYAVAEGMTPADLILLAGGFERGADPRAVEVVRRNWSAGPDEVEARSLKVALGDELPYPDPTLLVNIETRSGLPAPDAEGSGPNALGFEPGDELYVRRLPGFEPTRRVTVQGAVRNPGPYGLTRRDERLSSVLERSGGFRIDANQTGLRLVRDGLPVGVEVERVLREPGGIYDPVLEDGDRIVVPVADNTVLVRGAVLFETRAIYRPGMSLDDAVAAAGGYAPNAAENRVSIEYANGARDAVRTRFGFFTDQPDVEPGSIIFVPESVEAAGFDWDAALSRTLTVLSTFATVYLAVTR